MAGLYLKCLEELGHSHGLDEGHKSCINKDVKAALNSCTGSALSKFVNYIPTRANYIRNIKAKLGLLSNDGRNFSKATAVMHNENVLAYKEFLITKSYLFFVMFNPEIEIEDKLIHHLVSNKSADLKKSENLSTLLSKGTVYLKQYWDKRYSLNVSFAECSFKPQKLASFSTTTKTISSV